MKALVKYAEGPGNIEIREVPVPEIGPGDVLVEVISAGLCGTDMEIYHGHFRPVIPVTMGHEGSGIVAEVGERVRHIKRGDRVCFETSRTICGDCYFCRTGKYNLCAARKGLGYGANGTFAQYVAVAGDRTHRIPAQLTLDEAAICEPLSVAVKAVTAISRLKEGDTSVIIGAGTIGLFTLQVARAVGASKVIVIELRHKDRLQLARELGANHVVCLADGVSALEAVAELTDGMGGDVVFEVSGAPQAATQSIDLARKSGQVVLVGLYSGEVPVAWDRVVTREIEVRGSWTSGVSADWTRMMQLVASGQIKLRPLISHIMPLERWRDGFDLMRQGKCIKIVFHCSDQPPV